MSSVARSSAPWRFSQTITVRPISICVVRLVDAVRVYARRDSQLVAAWLRGCVAGDNGYVQRKSSPCTVARGSPAVTTVQGEDLPYSAPGDIVLPCS